MSRLFNLILDIVITALALWSVTVFVPGIDLASPDGVIYADGQYDRALLFIAVAAIFLLVNAVVKPILDLIGLPLTCLTFGLFALVINAAVFMLTGWLSTQVGIGLDISGFLPALIGAVVLALVRALLGFLTGGLRQTRD